MKRTKKKQAATEAAPPAPDLTQVVSAYADQAKAADKLAAVDTTHLDTAYANPEALATLNAERTRTAREKIQLDFERERMTARDDHQVLVERIAQRRTQATALTARTERAVAEGLADADEAAAELAEVRAFERGASPATATRRLMRAVRGWRREEFVYAIAGSALSAAGVTALVTGAATLPVWAGAAVAIALEVVLTVRVIRLIGQRAELAEQHKGQALTKGSAGAKALRFLTGQIIGLLAVSVLLNLAGLVFFDTSVLGVLGALGAGAAALASWSAWQASVAAAETVRSNVAAWQGSGWEAAREELRARAAGAHIPVPDGHPDPAPAPGAGGVDPAQLRAVLAALAEEQIAALADRGTDALAVMLNAAPPTGGVAGVARGGAPSVPDGGQAAPGEGATAADLGVPQGATPNATPAEQPVADSGQGDAEAEQGPVVEGRTWPRPPTPEQGRRQLVEYARWQIGRGQAPGIRDAARRMSTSARSITRYKEALAEDAAYAELMEAFRQQP